MPSRSATVASRSLFIDPTKQLFRIGLEQVRPHDFDVCDPLVSCENHLRLRLLLAQPEMFVYFLLKRLLLFPTHERTPGDPTTPRNLFVRAFILGCESGRVLVQREMESGRSLLESI
jgi:hypothetical protein